jgi:hypothetical protein
MNNLVCPTGFLDQNNDCSYSLNVSNTRSREGIDPKIDLSYYFNQYIVPKYGLNNINVNNVASFMKDLEMNWTKLDASLKGKVLDILVDNILVSGNYDFKNELLKKLNVNQPVPQPGYKGYNQVPSQTQPPLQNQAEPQNQTPPKKEVLTSKPSTKETFGETKKGFNKWYLLLLILLIVPVIFYFIQSKNRKLKIPYPM